MTQSEDKWLYFIDVSTANTGITMVQPSTHRILVTSVPFSKIHPSSTQKDEKMVEKFRSCKTMLDALIARYPPADLVVMEGIFINRRFVNSSEVLMKFHGFLIHYFLEHSIQYIPPSIIKKEVAGKGNAKKEVILEKITEKWKIPFTDTDQSDSFALFLTWNVMQEKPEEIVGEDISVVKYKEIVNYSPPVEVGACKSSVD